MQNRKARILEEYVKMRIISSNICRFWYKWMSKKKSHHLKAPFLYFFSLPLSSHEAMSQLYTQTQTHSHTSLCVKRCDGLQQSNNISWVPAGCEKPEPFKFVGENCARCLFLSALSSTLLCNESRSVLKPTVTHSYLKEHKHAGRSVD